MPGNYVVLDNDDARWLVGEVIASPAPTRDDLQSVRERRLTAIVEDELPLGDDAIDLVSEPEPEPVVEPEPEPADLLGRRTASGRGARRPGARRGAPAAQEPPARRPAPKKKGRASVPSWDEIMFGCGDDS